MLLLPVFLILMAVVLVKRLVIDTGFDEMNRLAGCFTVFGKMQLSLFFQFMPCQNVFLFFCNSHPERSFDV